MAAEYLGCKHWVMRGLTEIVNLAPAKAMERVAEPCGEGNGYKK